jgi:hypothetical protein
MGAPRALSYTGFPMRAFPLCLWVMLSVPWVAWAQSAPNPADTTDPGPAPQHAPATKPLELDRLLRPPGVAVVPSTEPSYGGRDRAAWQEQFIGARAEVVDLEGKVENIQNRLRQVTAGDWNYSPSGGEAVDPEVMKLRAQLRRDRQSLEASRQRLRDLQVEASLAGVPEEWRGP